MPITTARRWRRTVAAVAAAGCALAVQPALASASSATTTAGLPRIELRVLVVSDGSPSVEALATQLEREGVPYDRVLTARSDRPVVDAAFLSDAATASGRYQSVVLPNAEGGGLSPAELAALTEYETAFGVREVDAYVYPGAGVGLQAPTYAGALDGGTVTVGAAASDAGFGYLSGSLPVDDVSPEVTEVYGYLAEPAPDSGFTPLLTTTVGGRSGVLAGVHTTGTRERLVLTAAYNPSMQWFSALAPGIVGWLTRGVHLGVQRNVFDVHVDDVFLADSRWSTAADCTPGDDCVDPAVTTPDIRMTAADVDRLTAWQTRTGFRLDMVYNGGGSEAHRAANAGADPMADRLLAAQAQFPWINHTWDHPFLGCIQIAPTVQGAPWSCATAAQQQPRQDPAVPQAASGGLYWASQAFVTRQVADNAAWGRSKGLTDFDPTELVTGEHSGLRTLPNQPVDNPFLAPALAAAGVRVLASDASREPERRPVGAATTVPRHPMNIYYNTATYQEQVDEYNWYYTRRADGGSGICEDTPATTTCIAPLPAATAAQARASFDAHLVPVEVRNALRFVLSNDPRPFYAHQSNLAEDGLLYPVVEGVLSAYADVYDTRTTPLVQTDLTTQDQTLQRRAAWSAATGTGAWIDATGVHVRPGTAEVPLTVPAGTRVSGADLQAYAGELSGWVGAPTDAVPARTAAGYRLAAPSAPAPAPQAPGAPGTPTAVAGNAQVAVTWTAPATSGSAPLSGYRVRGYTAGRTAPVVDVAVAPSATSTVVAGLVNGTAYAFDVVAVNAAGTGAPSARTAAVVPSKGSGRPGAPVAVSASGGAGTATVRWSPPPSPGEAPVLGYVVTKRWSAFGRVLFRSTVTVPASSTSVTLRLPAGSWRFSVAAVNRFGTGPDSALTGSVLVGLPAG